MTIRFAGKGATDEFDGVKRLYIDGLFLEWTCPLCRREHKHTVSYSGQVDLPQHTDLGEPFDMLLYCDTKGCRLPGKDEYGHKRQHAAEARIRLDVAITGSVVRKRMKGAK